MIEIIIAIALIAFTIILFVIFKKPKNQEKQKEKPEKSTNTEKTTTPVKPPKKEAPIIDPSTLHPFDPSTNLIKSIKELKDLKNIYIYDNGHTLLFSDEKRFAFVKTKNIASKNVKIYSKSVESDSIVDISYSEDTNLIFVALKNSKSISFYKVNKDQNKFKIVKIEDKQINTQRKIEINSIVVSRNGQYLSTSGLGQDTEIQIYSTKSLNLLEKIDTGGIHNDIIKMNTDDNDLLVSTFLNEISVIHFEKNEKFNNELRVYETLVKFIRKPGLRGIKDKILFYEFSNMPNFLAIVTDSQMVKLYQNFGNIYESKMMSEFDIYFKPSALTFYIDSFFNGKIKGYIAISNYGDIYIYEAESGKLFMKMSNAHEQEILKLKMTKMDLTCDEDDSSVNPNEIKFDNKKDNEGKVVLISCSRDGRIKYWDLKI